MGASSYIGRHLVASMDPSKTVATYFRTPVEGGVFFDSLSMELTDIVDDLAEFSHAVVLYADSKPDSCAEDIENSTALNVKSTQSILQCLKKWGIKPIFASTESVFDGVKGDYVEADSVNPIMAYGQQKVDIERYIQSNHDEYVIIRLAKVFGSSKGDGTLFTAWIEAIENSQKIYCAHDQIFSPIHVNDVVDGIKKIIESGVNGVFHVSAWKAYNRIDLFQMLSASVSRYKTFEPDLVPISIRDLNLKEARPLNVSMSPEKLVAATGLDIKPVEQTCDEIVDQWYKEPASSGQNR